MYNPLLKAADTVDIGDGSFEGKFLGESTYWYRGDASIEQVTSPSFDDRFTKGTDPVLTFGFDDGAYWYRISFINPYNVEKQLYLYEFIS